MGARLESGHKGRLLVEVAVAVVLVVMANVTAGLAASQTLSNSPERTATPEASVVYTGDSGYAGRI